MRNGEQLHSTCVGCIQPTQVACSCSPMFLIYQPEDGQLKGPKHVVVVAATLELCGLYTTHASRV